MWTARRPGLIPPLLCLVLTRSTRALTINPPRVTAVPLRPPLLRRCVRSTSLRASGAAPPARAQSTPSLQSTVEHTGVNLMNSLTGKVEPFETITPGQVKWYICGPTVYDAAHLGHARNYVGFDIVRRVLATYFGYDIFYVMNITDIDDKIILRVHANHLEAMIATAADALPMVGESGRAALEAALAKARETMGIGKPGLPELVAAQHALRDAAVEAAFETPLAPCEVQTAMTKLTAEQEASFFGDLEALNCLPPDVTTRVTDYVPEIIEYIEQIMSNGYCYESNGSVYFDTLSFSKSKGKLYGKLEPGKVGDLEALAEGEGALSTDASAEKRSQADFVLWKASKTGEPAWPSPWGNGRPGWHIECSAMASDVLGCQVDVNAGGVDLKFPHHENQMAQAEAYFDCCSWVNYFLHSGHLGIDGLKMSKSLKNFITIQESLERFSGRQLRFLFLLHRYHEPMEYSENTMAAAADLERRFASFEASLGARLREAAEAQKPAAAAEQPPVFKMGAAEKELRETLTVKRQGIHAALLNSIDTPTAVKQLEQLIRATNTYMQAAPSAAQGGALLHSVARYYDRMMQCFGLEGRVLSLVQGDGAGGGSAGGSGGSGATASPLQIAAAMSGFRDTVRKAAIASKKGGGTADLGGELLRVCDELRDDVLPSLGVRVEDRSSGTAQFTLDDPKLILAETERRREAAHQAEAERELKMKEQEQMAELQRARAGVPPSSMFLPEHDALFEREESFANFDADGCVHIHKANKQDLPIHTQHAPLR